MVFVKTAACERNRTDAWAGRLGPCWLVILLVLAVFCASVWYFCVGDVQFDKMNTYRIVTPREGLLTVPQFTALRSLFAVIAAGTLVTPTCVCVHHGQPLCLTWPAVRCK
jgi:hypothetical protein